ncbi:pentapeptide repeat-containing protein [Thioalkalivibrio sp. ALJT]|uniref:pentapeptide repeat-containing protein n=1 Tax=Thioalkalivibrio sp. ALJT TaxID=1158146 RepID=UPI000477A6FB
MNRDAVQPPATSEQRPPDDPGMRPTLWFTQRDGRVCGPFPEATIGRFLILGRLHPDDHVSHDRETWWRLNQCPHLIPEELRHAHTSEGRKRLEQARLREDERLRERRHGEPPAEILERRKGDRRCPEAARTLSHRQQWRNILDRPATSGNRWLRGPQPWLASGVVVSLAALLLISSALQFEPGAVPDCTQPASPGVNWNYCDQSGADLRGVDLSGASLHSARLTRARLRGARLSTADLRFVDLSLAGLQQAALDATNLTGADLTRADLAGARLDGADLSHANLSGANLNNARLDGARLRHSIWVDGRRCAHDSVGRCD